MSEAGHPTPRPDWRPPGLPLPPPRPPRQRFGWVALAAVAVVALGAGIGIAIATTSGSDHTTSSTAASTTAVSTAAAVSTSTAVSTDATSSTAAESTSATPDASAPRAEPSTAVAPASTAAPGSSATTSVTTLAPVIGTEFRDPQGRYAITVGADWSALPGVSAADIETWSIGAAGRAFAPNVNVLVQDTPGFALDDYLAYSLTHMGDLDVVDHRVVTGSDGRQLGLIEYAGEPPGSSIPLHFLAIADVGDGTAVLATFTALPDDFAELRAEVERYMLTLQAT